MYIAMNRFRIAPGREQDFIEIWRKRDTYLSGVPGFKQFHMLQGPSTAEFTLFASHSVSESAEAFPNWMKSEAFRNAHASAGTAKGIYLGPPQFEGFEAVV
ncbi:MAG: antibiotic biosynthesis monooxygenase [Steroidobacteraceae bacterium]